MSVDSPSPSVDAGKPDRTWQRVVLRLALFVSAVVMCFIAGTAFAAYLVYDHITRPGTPGSIVRIEIPSGVTGDAAGKVLSSAGLIDHEVFFRLAIRLDASHKPIKQGFYDIPRGLSPIEILRQLQSGPNVSEARYKITMVEGQTIAQMSKQFADPDAFIAAASDPELIASLGISAQTLEGFLMPDTYFFTEEPTPKQVVERMVGEFKEEYAQLVAEFPEAADRDLMEVVTIASLIEEESRVEEERPLVAAVIYNRIAKRMTLDLDCTLQFALDKYGQRLMDSDKDVESPYNTYRNPGLPPGPISNPGVSSLRAALQPANVDYLYFVSNADGKTHTFSTTMSDHNRAVAKFRKDIAVQRKEQAEHAQAQQQ
ncbi:MAG: aminodeoxychorismate lyase [Candidatus Hydrogenedentota bacterium]